MASAFGGGVEQRSLLNFRRDGRRGLLTADVCRTGERYSARRVFLFSGAFGVAGTGALRHPRSEQPGGGPGDECKFRTGAARRSGNHVARDPCRRVSHACLSPRHLSDRLRSVASARWQACGVGIPAGAVSIAGQAAGGLGETKERLSRYGGQNLAPLRDQPDRRQHHHESGDGAPLPGGTLAQHAARVGLGGAQDPDADGRAAPDRTDLRLPHADP